MDDIAQPSGRRVGRPAGVQETRSRLLKEASYLFARQGFEGTTLREISNGLGLSGPALLHHFGTKKRLYSEILGEIVGSLTPALPSPDEIGTVDGVLGMVGKHFDWTLRNPHLSQLLMRELMENRARVERAQNLSMKPVMDAYIGCIRRGQQAGSLPAFDAEMFAFSFTGAIAHFVAAAPTARRILGIDSDDRTLARFRTAYLDSIAAMLAGHRKP
jgi:AcrR family transcriptional regulator